MGYIHNNLMPREKVLYAARVSRAVFLPSVLMFFIALAVFVYGLSKTIVPPHAADVPAAQFSGSHLMGALIVFFGVFLFFYALWLALQALILYTTTEFAVTNRRVIAKRGFIRRRTLEILLPQVESVSVNQSVLGRLLDFGVVTVTGTGGTSESFRAIEDPVGVRRKINQIIEAYLEYRQRASRRGGR